MCRKTLTFLGGIAFGLTLGTVCIAVAQEAVLEHGTDTAGNIVQVLTDTAGRLLTAGAAANGTALAGNPVLVAGTDGTNARTVSVDTAGRPQINITDDTTVLPIPIDGSAVPTSGIVAFGNDGTNAQSIAVDTSGRPIVVGAAAVDAATTGNPLYVGSRASAATPTAMSTDGDAVPLWLSLRGDLIIATPTCDGTRVNISTSTTSATGTTTDNTLYRITVAGVASHCIWGATATSTTGMYLTVGTNMLERAEGTSFSCITEAGTGTVAATPCDYNN